MGRVLRAAALAAVLLSAARADGDRQSAELPAKAVTELVKAGTALARSGQVKHASSVLSILVDGRAPEAAVDPLRKALAAVSQPAKTAAPPANAVAALRTAARETSTALATVAPERRASLASLLIRIDSEDRAAEEAAGNVWNGSRWCTPEESASLAHRAEIQQAIVRARSLSPAIVTSESTHPALVLLHGRAGTAVSSGSVTLASAEHPEWRLRRILLEFLKASAVAEFVRGGSLAVPKFGGKTVLILRTKATYLRALDQAVVDGGLTRESADRMRELKGFWDKRGHGTFWSATEAPMEASLLAQFVRYQLPPAYAGDVRPALLAGHVNWTCLNFLGVPAPGMASLKSAPPKKGAGWTTDSPEELREFRDLWRVAGRSSFGTRALLSFLARRRDDPPWSASLGKERADIVGVDLLKATCVAEWLQESSKFGVLLRATAQKTNDPVASMETALGEPLATFETRWRSWLLGVEPGLLQRLAVPEQQNPAEARLLKHLDDIRTRTVWGKLDVEPLRIDDSLSAGGAAHAAYLLKNPKQLEAWPDAHEEYPDAKGFSVEGSRAGLASVICAGSNGPEDAVDRWMATFYHRLPLLDPGLVRVGWAMEGGVAVLDAGSMVADVEDGAWCYWPADKALSVPLGFEPELPHPVPGENQAEWGYPVTLQRFGDASSLDIEMTLSRDGGPAEPCWFSSPQSPTNPDLAPAGAWCLIPKRRLAPTTRYTVTVKGIPGIDTTHWSFTTGR